MRPSLGSAITAGLFARFAAGANYPGAPVPIAVIACVPFCCGRDLRFSSVMVTGAAAIDAGGLC